MTTSELGNPSKIWQKIFEYTRPEFKMWKTAHARPSGSNWPRISVWGLTCWKNNNKDIFFIDMILVVRKSPSSGVKTGVHSSLYYNDYLVSIVSSRCLLVAQWIFASIDTKHACIPQLNGKDIYMVKSPYFSAPKRVIFSQHRSYMLYLYIVIGKKKSLLTINKI